LRTDSRERRTKKEAHENRKKLKEVRQKKDLKIQKRKIG
jgi:hypothetical protein